MNLAFSHRAKAVTVIFAIAAAFAVLQAAALRAHPASCPVITASSSLKGIIQP